MEYKFCENDNFEDYSSGRVLYRNRGIPNFPVRLINEIFRRCIYYCENKSDCNVGCLITTQNDLPLRTFVLGGFFVYFFRDLW